MANQKVIVRRVDRYSDSIAAGIGRLFPCLYPDNAGKPISKELLQAIIDSPNSEKFIALNDKEIVGTATVNLVIADLYKKVHLDNFITHPDVRGQGYGLAIWDEVIKWAHEKNAKKITLVSNNKESIEFYIHRGAIIREDSYLNVML